MHVGGSESALLVGVVWTSDHRLTLGLSLVILSVLFLPLFLSIVL